MVYRELQLAPFQQRGLKSAVQKRGARRIETNTQPGRHGMGRDNQTR